MALQDVTLPVDFGKGIDTKTDAKKVVAGSYLLIENGVFTKLSRVQKRNGYTKVSSAILGGGNLAAPTMIRVFQGELVCTDGGVFYGFSETLNCWVPKGNYQSIDLSNRCFYDALPALKCFDTATLNGFTLYCGIFANSSSTISTVAGVVDESDGNYILPPVVRASQGSIKAITLGSTALALVAANNPNITLNILSLSSGGASIGNDIVLDTLSAQVPLGAAGTSTGAAIVYQTSGAALKIITIDTAGAITHSTTFDSVIGGASTIAVVPDSGTGNIWVYWTSDSAGNPLKYAVFSSTLATVRAATSIEAPAGSILSVGNPTAVPTSATQQTVYYGVSRTIGTNATGYATRKATVTTGGTVSSPQYSVYGVIPVSTVVTVGSRSYYVALRPTVVTGTLTDTTVVGDPQDTYYLIDAAGQYVVSRFAAERAYTGEQTLGQGVIRNLTLTSATKAVFGGSLTQNNVADAIIAGYQASGAFVWTFEWGTNRTYKSEVCGDLLIGNGALLSAYDGAVCTEWGFNMRPDIIEVIQNLNGGGSSVTRSYCAVYQWTDAEGQLHQSEPSNPATVVANDNSNFTFYISTLDLTGKTSVSVILYATQANGTIYYQVPLAFQAFPPLSNPSQGYVSYLYQGATVANDASLLALGLQLYTTGGVLDNNPPPPSMVIVPRQNRLWYVDAENSNNTYYTKSFEIGTGLSPSLSLFVEGNPDIGPILGLSPMDDKLVFFKQQGITWLSGDGANDTGQGATLTSPQNLPSDVGIATGPSIVLTPKGVIFQSPKGFYLLDRSLGLHYADQYFNGSAAEAYNSQTVSDARLVAGVSQVRFLTQSGATLVYDYIFDKWASFTNHLGTASDNWNSAYVYLRTNGSIYKENTSTYLDDATAFALRVKTSWLALGSVQGFERVRHLLTLGDYLSGTSAGHGIQTSFAYNFDGDSAPVYGPAVPFYFSASTGGRFQYRTFPTQQKCDSVSLLIEEIVTGASGEYLDLTNLEFNAGIKKGLHKVTAGNSVG